LEARRKELLHAAAGRFLLASVHEEYGQRGQPEVLKLARELFRRFTNNAYELVLDRGAEQPIFHAVENFSGDGKSLSQLSDGTRIQLLLAARAAFAAHVDTEAELPFILDEVLTTSDPQRFRAIAHSLEMMAREENRQIFYMTANPADIEWWNEMLRAEGRDPVTAIDLGHTRRIQVSGEDNRRLSVPAMPRIPSPAGISAEKYGLVLQVPPFDPFRTVSGLHLFHLLRDDLPLLHELLSSKIECIGAWRSFTTAVGSANPFDERAAAKVTALADVAEAFLRAWRIGRGRRVDDEVLQDRGGAISDTFLPALSSLARMHGGEPRSFMRAVEERKEESLKGFGPQRIERLRSHLVEAGCLDDREPLDEPSISGRVLVAVSDHLHAGHLTGEQVARLVHQLSAQADSR
jgi:hypothetical protein